MKSHYVHGYTSGESIRLQDQASTLTELLHSDTRFPAGSRVLEAGCGVGAQTVTLSKNSPEASITSVDISHESIKEAEQNVCSLGLSNVTFMQGDIFDLQFPAAFFDHVFVCFVLEHMSDPVAALEKLGKVLKPGGTITVIEGDHGSAYFHPECEESHRAIQCQVELQKRAGGNAMIGRELYPLLDQAGYGNIRVSPRMVYADASRPGLVSGFIKNTFTAMISGVKENALEAGLVDRDTFERGIEGLLRTAEPDGVFCYTFFKAVAEKTA